MLLVSAGGLSASVLTAHFSWYQWLFEVCPITLTLFVDPVSTKYGHTYERAAITEHVGKNGTDPLTRQPLTSGELVPNIAIRKAIEQYKSSTPWWERD